MGSSSNAPTSPIILVLAPNSPMSPSSSENSSDELESKYFDIKTFYGEELLNAYRPRRLHPVHFGNLFHHGWLMMVQKLGHGAFSTVWLVKDIMYNEFSLFIIYFTDFSPSKLLY